MDEGLRGRRIVGIHHILLWLQVRANPPMASCPPITFIHLPRIPPYTFLTLTLRCIRYSLHLPKTLSLPHKSLVQSHPCTCTASDSPQWEPCLICLMQGYLDRHNGLPSIEPFSEGTHAVLESLLAPHSYELQQGRCQRPYQSCTYALANGCLHSNPCALPKCRKDA